MKLFRRIVFATDFSRGARPPMERAFALAKGTGAELVVVHVLQPVSPLPGNGAVLPRLYNEIEAVIRKTGEKSMQKLLALARRQHVRATGRLLGGLPVEAINGAARRAKADLVVTGTHGRQGIRRILLGSVAAGIVAGAPCPVLTVRSRAR
jgi:nucleotide-binding universal stress UspA family protein